MKLAIIRHGEAGYAASDLARPLTEVGQLQAQQLANWLVAQDWEQPKLLASPYLRAQQTAKTIATTMQLPIVTQAEIFPEARPQTIIELLIKEQQDTILVAHQPLVGYLTTLLLQGRAQPLSWNPAECWLLEGDIFATNCLSLAAQFQPTA